VVTAWQILVNLRMMNADTTRIDQVTSDLLRLASPTRREREQVHNHS
jgi:hypothetical protein